MNSDMDSYKTLLRGAGLLFIGIFVSKILNYVFRFIIARAFTPSEYGLFALGTAIIGLFMAIALLGLPSGVSRYISEYKTRKEYDKLRGTITFSLKLVTISSIIITIFLYLSSNYIESFFIKDGLSQVIKILCIGMPFYIIFTLVINMFYGFQKSEYVTISGYLSENILKVTIILLLLFIGFNGTALPMTWTITAVIIFLIALYFLQVKTFPFLGIREKFIEPRKELLVFSLPLIFVSTMWIILQWTDTIMLGYFMTAKDVAIYEMVLSAGKILLMFATMFSVVFMPLITSLYTNNKTKEIEAIYKSTTKWITVVSLPICIYFLIFPKMTIQLMFGSQYLEGTSVLIILSIGYFLHAIMFLGGSFLAALKYSRLQMIIVIITGMLNILLNYYLIPIYGIIGSAIATSISFILWKTTETILAYKITKIHPLSIDLLKAFIAAAILSIVLKYIVAPFVNNLYLYAIFSLIFFGSYILFTILIKCFDKNDAESIELILKKSPLKIPYIDILLNWIRK